MKVDLGEPVTCSLAYALWHGARRAIGVDLVQSLSGYFRLHVGDAGVAMHVPLYLALGGVIGEDAA